MVLDFGFWSRRERDELRVRAAEVGAQAQVVFLDVDRQELLRRLTARKAVAVHGTFRVDDGMPDDFTALFERARRRAARLCRQAIVRHPPKPKPSEAMLGPGTSALLWFRRRLHHGSTQPARGRGPALDGHAAALRSFERRAGDRRFSAAALAPDPGSSVCRTRCEQAFFRAHK